MGEMVGFRVEIEITLTKVGNKIESQRFVKEGSFTNQSKNDLIKLTELFQKSHGGIWGAHSFDCFIECGIPPKSIVGVVEDERSFHEAVIRLGEVLKLRAPITADY